MPAGHPRKVCIVTGTRAEYGLMRRLIHEIDGDKQLQLQLIATGAHLEEAYGLTRNEILSDGIAIDAEVPINLSDDTRLGIAHSTSMAIEGLSKAYADLQPEIVVLLGDRYEIFAAATAALIMRLPIAHLHGGETTEGAMDEALRHAITKMAHLHFAATNDYSRRIIQLGENPGSVFCVGAPGVENVLKTKLMERSQLEQDLGYPISEKLMVVTYHPVTLDDDTPESQFAQLLAALDRFEDMQIILTKANADMGGQSINRMIDAYAGKRPKQVSAHASLGMLRYLSVVQHASVVVGNSSSGIIETPSFGIPTVNIGDRQKGRTRPASVIDCSAQTDDIVAAIEQALTDDVQAMAKSCQNPYFGENTAQTIKDILKRADLSNVHMKHFYDMPA